MEHTEFLYHYTSIHNLALILKNKTFRFCNLLNVDDPDEAYTSDLGSAGKYALVSCWTATNEDVLPMWSMYTTNMSGVRIKMKKNPFKVYQYEPGELHFKEKVESNINYYDENICKYAIAPSCPKLIKVEYTNDESLLYPKICIENGDNVTISFEKMGKYKREYCNGVQREHNKKLNNGLPILHKVPPKRDYGRYFCIMAEKGGTSHGGLTEKLSPFFHAKKQEVNAYGR